LIRWLALWSFRKARSDRILAAAEHVGGPQNSVCAVCLDWNSEVGECGKHIDAAVAGVDSGGVVIIVAEMMGGTTRNLAIAEMRGSDAEVIAELNLPVLLKLLTTRDSTDITAPPVAAEETGRTHIRCAVAPTSNG
jgi:PTS system mannose-specific IIA component